VWIKILKCISHILAWLPLVYLLYGGYNHQLGGDPQEKVLHELGSWGLIFLLLSLSMTPARILYSRFPWIRFRRMLGLYSAFYLLLHLIIYVIFFLGFSASELLNEIIERPYITVGMLAFSGLIPLAITSTRRAQRRLGKKWKKLHQLVYPIAGLGLVHFVWQSKSDLNEPLAYVSWGIILIVLRFYPAIRKKMNKPPVSLSREKTGIVD